MRAACLRVHRTRDKLRGVIESPAVSRGDLKIRSTRVRGRGRGESPSALGCQPPRIRIASHGIVAPIAIR